MNFLHFERWCFSFSFQLQMKHNYEFCDLMKKVEIFHRIFKMEKSIVNDQKTVWFWKMFNQVSQNGLTKVCCIYIELSKSLSLGPQVSPNHKKYHFSILRVFEVFVGCTSFETNLWQEGFPKMRSEGKFWSNTKWWRT